MKEINQQHFFGERILFSAMDLNIKNTIFDEGESPLKHSENISCDTCLFRWKYPFWYSKNISLKDCTLFEMARAGIWYTDDISVKNTLVEAPKEFRRCQHVTLDNVSFPNAEETFWNCEDITLKNVTAKGDYFGMNCKDVRLDHFNLYGNYCFDGAKNVEVHDSKFLSKDCFWNSENVTIYDSFISGEYLAWNSKNVTFVNCTIESLQGLCYIENLKMINCRLINTTLAFEYSSVDAEITTKVDSVLNPSSGTIQAKHIDELFIEKDHVDPGKTIIKVTDGSALPAPKETEWTLKTNKVLKG